MPLKAFSHMRVGCSPGTDRVISYNTSLVPSSGVWASSEDTVFNPADNLFHRNNIPLRLWCTQSFRETTEEEGPTAAGMGFSDLNLDSSFYVLVNFSSPLLLTHIITSGFSNGYVNNFTVLSSLSSEGPLTMHNNSDTMQVK